MIISELKRYLRSKYNILNSLICLIPVLLSYYFTNVEKKQLYNEIMKASEDLNLTAAISTYEGINGFTYLFNFLFSSDFYIIFVLLLSLSFGIVLGSVEFKYRSSGFGNMIFSRVAMKKGTYQILIAQIIYVLLNIISFFIILTSVTLTFFPVDTSKEFTLGFYLETSSIITCLLIVTAHAFKLVIYMILTTFLTYILSYFINNKYIISFIPLMIYAIPLFTCSLIGNLVKPIGHFLSNFIPDMYLLSIYNTYSTQSFSAQMEICLPLLIIIIILVAGVRFIKEVQRNYL